MSQFQVIPFSELITETTLSSVMTASDTEQGSDAHAVCVTADQKPGYPCRLTLEDANPGEELILFHGCFHPASSPYRSSGPMYVRLGKQETRLPANQLPAFIDHRLVSVRVYREDGMMLDADVMSGSELSQCLTELTHLQGREGARYVHVHNAATGCFLLAIRMLVSPTDQSMAQTS